MALSARNTGAKYCTGCVASTASRTLVAESVTSVCNHEQEACGVKREEAVQRVVNQSHGGGVRKVGVAPGAHPACRADQHVHYRRPVSVVLEPQQHRQVLQK